ncbi:Dihydropteroate synthase [Falsiruegeria litorea R37]|uniref:Dihydropteroate synthase n=1 Tax=Falsiruegeria litorea R37 TaxID=1200284 RepID=A0A1Y5T8M8_9RHOB|nr:dihydropteroate synthase [Falsiruegeria litorea]SLN58439.1 Dihydropteroate synthase [Falsiruegeria litorea R37]
MTLCYRPLPQSGQVRPADAVSLVGSEQWFTHAEVLERGRTPEMVPAQELPQDVAARLTAPREALAGLDMNLPHIMGILNTTPDSFSDGGLHAGVKAAVQGARDMVAAGATILDVGGESTRPGAAFVPHDEEIARTAPVIAAIRAETQTAISIDTRKAPVAQAAVSAGATVVNDVSGFTFDPELAPLCADLAVPVCVMHAQGDPATMQDDPQYDDVVLDVYQFLEDQVARLEKFGLRRSQIIVDPGIGFGKTMDHNLALLRNLSVFHGIGCPVLLGASRKRFIGAIGQEPQAHARAPGSIAVALAAAAQSVQILRVHDVAETAQALRLWQAVR